MKRMSKLLGLAVILSGGLLSCSSSEDIDNGETKYVNMLSDPEPIVLTEEQQVFANDNNGFTLNFLKTVNDVDKSGKSYIYSPLSITYVLGMVNDAAIGQTEQELEQTLGFHKGGIQAVNDYCKKLIDGLPKVDNKVNYVITHCCPKAALFDLSRYVFYEPDKVNTFLDHLISDQNLQFDKWFFGHYHEDLRFGPWNMLYQTIEEIDLS